MRLGLPWCWNLNQLVVGRAEFRLLGRAGRTQNAQDGDFVAGLKFRTAEAILPCLQGKNAALDHLKADFLKELNYISEGEGGIQFVVLGFFDQCFYEPAS